MSDQLKNIRPNSIPKHVAIIMDGNGRWAKKHGYLRAIGHKSGVKSVRAVVEASTRLKIETLTLYAFSTENWNRPKAEIDALMELLVSALNKELPTFISNNIRLQTIGETESLPSRCRKKLQDVIDKTKNNTGLNLVLALSYSSKSEIIRAVKNIAKEVVSEKVKINDISTELINNHLYTAPYSDPDLLIRTSGEYRLSNFLLWQVAYTELYFSDKLWPDFNQEDFYEAILEYQNRERRFGKTSEQIKS